MKLLIVKLGSIGDIIHALPSLAAIRRQLPDAEISWVAEKHSAEILRDNGSLDRLIEVDTRVLRGGKTMEDLVLEMSRQVRDLRKFKFDIALDLQGLLKSAVIAKISGARRRFGFAKSELREQASRFFLTHPVAVRSGVHVIRKNLDLVRMALDIDVPEIDFEFPVTTNLEHRLEAHAIKRAAGPRFALLNPAGGWVTKLWPAEKFGRLADRLWAEFGITPVVSTGPRDTEIEQSVRKSTSSGRTIFTTLSLKGFYEVAKSAAVYIGGDTGPTHLAVAAGTPVVGLFGPTEWWRNGSPVEADLCVERTDIACRINCHRRNCSNWICLDIDVETVVEAVGKRLGVSRNDSSGNSDIITL